MKIYNGIRVNCPEYDQLSKVPKLTPAQFHRALARYTRSPRLLHTDYESVIKQCGNTAECSYDFDEKKWKIRQMHFLPPSKMNQPQPNEEPLTNEEIWDSLKSEREAQKILI